MLDALLVEAAVEAGAELREGFTVEQILVDDGRVTGIRGHERDGASVTEHARVVIGADGRHSLVAKAVKPQSYNERPPLQSGYYAYWSDVPVDGFELFDRPHRAAAPTNDGLTLIVGGWPQAEFAANKKDVEGNFWKMLDMAPAFAERVRAGTRETRSAGTADLTNDFRKPYGDGWALVGDAGYNKDPITAQGITDAFRDAEALTAALDDTFTGRADFGDAMASYQAARDAAVLPIYEFTCELAKLEPRPRCRRSSVRCMETGGDGRLRGVIAGVVSPAEFFAPEHAGRSMAAAA